MYFIHFEFAYVTFVRFLVLNFLLSFSLAFATMGYNVSPQFVQTVVVKFDHFGRRALTLDNFIQACVMLKNLTDMFKQRDTAMAGRVNLSYEDFMCMAVLNKP